MAALKFSALDLSVLEQIQSEKNAKVKVYNAALMYIQAGYYVIPVVKNGKAIPPKKYAITYNNAARNKKTIDNWYNPSDGMFAGWNIGLATGMEDGIFVLDIDNHGIDNGFETMERLLEEETEVLPAGPRQITPNGGKHILFGWQKDAASSTGKIGPGIDTRGGTIDSCKGHVVVFPSKINGKEYEWETGGPLPTVSKWIIEKLGATWTQPARGTGRGNEAITDADLEDEVPMAQVTRMLNAIDPNEVTYEEWIKLGMAIKSQHPDEGLEAWDNWSAHGERYEPSECKTRWNGFANDGSVRMATLFYYAKRHGHELEPTDKRPNRLGLVTERMNATHAVVVTGNKIRVLVELDEPAEMAEPYNLLTKADFKTMCENDKICTNPEKAKFVSVADIWLADPHRRTYDNGMGMYPDGAPKGYYNTWRGFKIKPTKGKCKLFKKHILSTLCGDDKDINKFVLDWCADLFQNPADPKGTAIVMRGMEGTGKGTFANTIGMMCAPHYTHLIDEAHLTGQFNSHMANSLVVFADEITWGGNRKTGGKLKGLVTERHLLLERKGIDAVSQRNMVHMIIASNSEWVVPAGANSRRWLVLDVKNNVRSDREYFTAIYKELDKGGKEAFMYEMMNRKITSNLMLAPETAALEEQRSMSVPQDSDIGGWWMDVLIRGAMPCDDFNDENMVGWPKEVNKIELYDAYAEWCRGQNLRIEHSNVFYKKMGKYGFDNLKKRIPGGRTTVYQVPEYDRAVATIKTLTGITLETVHNEQS